MEEWQPSPLGYIRNHLLELGIYVKFFCTKVKLNKLVIFPSNIPEKNPASLLRAYNIASQLNREDDWLAIIVPPSLTLTQRRRVLRTIDPHVLLIQMARHPLNRPELYVARKIVFDMDDADYLWDGANEIVQKCCTTADHIIAGSTYIAQWVRRSTNRPVTVIWTSAPMDNHSLNIKSHTKRRNVIAWGHSRPQDYPIESDFIQNFLLKVSDQVEIEYWVFGVNDDKTKELVCRKLVDSKIAVRTFQTMPFDEFIRIMNDVSVGLQVLDPSSQYSQAKSFGKILGYILAGVVVVASNSGEHPDFFNGENGALADEESEWVEKVVTYLNDHQLRESTAKKALTSFDKKLSTSAVVAEYKKLFSDLMG